MSDLTPDQRQLFKQARETNLLKQWAGGRKLSASELAEIAHLLPPGTTDQEAPPTHPGGFHRAKYQRPLLEYEPVFETKHRQLKRWISIGRERGDPPPLDDPPKMAAWWEKHMKQRVPLKIAALAASAAAVAAPQSPDPAQKPGAPPDPTKPGGTPFDLSAVDVEEGEAVKQARQLLGGAFDKLKQAYSAGRDDEIRLWQPRWEKAAEAFRKASLADRERQKQLGLVISRARVEDDLEEATEMLKLMRENMVRRVFEKLPALDPVLAEKISAAILAVREQEDLVFRNLGSLTKPADVLDLLAA